MGALEHPDEWDDWPLVAPCRYCRHDRGYIRTHNGQDILRCAKCDQYVKAVSRAETGREQRSLRTRPTIKPSKRARIFLRDGDACVLCHRSDVQLDVGHLIDIESGRAEGMSDEELFADEALAVMCATCNSGISAQPIPLKLAMRIFWVRERRRQGLEP